jgi:hypothetical protein
MSLLLSSGGNDPIGSCRQFVQPPFDVNINWLALSGQDVARASYPSLSPFFPVGSMAATQRTNLSNAPASNYGATNGTLFVIPGTAGTSAIQTSPDGITWTNRTTPSCTVIGIIWTGTRFLAATTTGVIYSPDGVTWTETTSAPSGLVVGQQTLAYSSSLGMTVCLGSNISTTIIYTLLDASTTWVMQTCPSFNQRGVCWTGSAFLVSPSPSGGALGASILSSTNGTSWNVSYPGTYIGTGGTVNIPIISNGSGVVVMQDTSTQNTSVWVMSVWVSTNNGVNWQSIKLPSGSLTSPLSSAVYENGRFILCFGSAKTIAYSTDGLHWTVDPVCSNSGAQFSNAGGIIYMGGLYFVWDTNGYNITVIESATKFYLWMDDNNTYQNYIRAT